MDAQTLADCTGATLLRASMLLPHFLACFKKWGIDTPVRQAAFLAQVGVESQNLTRLEENLNYRAEALVQTFPKHFPTLEVAKTFVGKPRAIADKCYGGRYGNGPDEGYKYRGRGFKQLTFKANYQAYQDAACVMAVANPDLLLQPEYAADSAGWFWHANGCNAFADRRDWVGLSKKINGGTNGLAQRLTLTQRALKALQAL